MRPKGPEAIARVFFCYLTGKRIIFLHVFIKKTRKTPSREIQLARQRLAELRQQENAGQEAKKPNEKRRQVPRRLAR
jgi:phage-related protein